VVPREFIHDEPTPRAQEAADLLEGNRQAVDMVKRKAHHGDIEATDVVEILDATSPEDPTVRSPWVDGDDLITRAVHGSR